MSTPPDDDRFLVFTPALIDKAQAFITGGNKTDMSRSFYHLTEDVDQAERFREGNARQVADDLNRGEPKEGIGVVPGSEGRYWMTVRAPAAAP